VKKILILVLLAFGFPATAGATVIATTYDVSVVNNYPNSNFVSSGFAGTTSSGELSYDYLQFALGGQTTGTATLTLHYQEPYQGQGTLGIFAANSDAWNSAMTYSNQVGFGALLATFTPTVDGATYTIDVSSFVDSQSDGIASFVIASYNNNDSWRYFSGGSETLTATVPEPATVGLFGVGAIGLFLLRRRQTA